MLPGIVPNSLGFSFLFCPPTDMLISRNYTQVQYCTKHESTIVSKLELCMASSVSDVKKKYHSWCYECNVVMWPCKGAAQL